MDDILNDEKELLTIIANSDCSRAHCGLCSFKTLVTNGKCLRTIMRELYDIQGV